MNRFLKRANSRISLGGAATLLIMTTLFGQILGFLRTSLVNASFSDVGPQSTDIYFAAFKIPDFFFLTIAAGAMGVAFVPILSEHLQKNDRKGMWELANSLLNVLTIVMLAVALIILVAAEPLMHLVSPDLSPEQLGRAATIMRLVAFNPLFFTVSGIFTAAQQTFGRFFFYAIGPIVYNLSIIASIFLFRGNIGIVGLGIGAFAGGLLQVLTACLGLTGLNFHWRPKIRMDYDFKRIIRALPPRSLDQGIDSINSIVETNRARKLGEGYLSAYENAFILHTAPILLLGTAISTAAFPRLAERLAQGRPDLFRKDFIGVLRVLIWVSLPVVVIAYFCRGYLARLIYKQGSPTIALIFGFLAIAIIFRIVYTLFSRYFYAHKDTVTPLMVSIFAIGLNIVLAFNLARPDAYGAAGLALAQSIVAGSEVAILFFLILWRDRTIFNREFWGSMVRIVSVTGFTLLTAFIMIQIFPLGLNDRGIVTLGSKLALIAGSTLLVHISISSLFGLEEARVVLSRVKQIILRPVRIQ